MYKIFTSISPRLIEMYTSDVSSHTLKFVSTKSVIDFSSQRLYIDSSFAYDFSRMH